MSHYEVEYTLGAQLEIERAYMWIRERAPKAAEKWREDLIGKIEELAKNPVRHPIAPESENFPKEIRLLLFRKRQSQFRIYYAIDRKRIVILTMRRSARKPLEEDDITV